MSHVDKSELIQLELKMKNNPCFSQIGAGMMHALKNNDGLVQRTSDWTPFVVTGADTARRSEPTPAVSNRIRAMDGVGGTPVANPAHGRASSAPRFHSAKAASTGWTMAPPVATVQHTTVSVMTPQTQWTLQGMDITVLLDMSGSMANAHKARDAQESLEGFIWGAESCMLDGDRMQIVGCDNHHEELQKFKERSKMSVKSLRGLGIADLRGFGGDTHLWDAVKWCIQQRKANTSSHSNPFVLLVLTDGEDNGSTTSEQELQTLLAHPGFPHCHVHFVGLGDEKHFAPMQRMSNSGIKHVNFSHVADGCAGVIQSVFRNFATTVQTVRQTVYSHVTVVGAHAPLMTMSVGPVCISSNASTAGAGTGSRLKTHGIRAAQAHRNHLVAGPMASPPYFPPAPFMPVAALLGNPPRHASPHVRGGRLGKCTAPLNKPEVCCYFLSGNCMYGARCRNLHPQV
jgi:Mg-chelatase subunit ChlD